MKKRILVIEDEEIIAEMIRDNLEVRGYDVICSYSGIEGLRKAEIYSPDLIALDIMMPGLDGINVLRRLKTNENTKGIPVIIISVTEGCREEGLKVGAAAFMKKPFDFNLLTDKIRTFTDKKTVMVVDDSESSLKVISGILAKMGYEVTCAADEKSMFETLSANKPDIILMDIVLPDTDGLAIVRRLKAHKEYSGIPVIVFSGYVSDELSENEIAGVISGEFSAQDLADEVKKCLG